MRLERASLFRDLVRGFPSGPAVKTVLHKQAGHMKATDQSSSKALAIPGRPHMNQKQTDLGTTNDSGRSKTALAFRKQERRVTRLPGWVFVHDTREQITGDMSVKPCLQRGQVERIEPGPVGIGKLAHKRGNGDIGERRMITKQMEARFACSEGAGASAKVSFAPIRPLV
jgi:hypothetical protein